MSDISEQREPPFRDASKALHYVNRPLMILHLAAILLNYWSIIQLSCTLSFPRRWQASILHFLQRQSLLVSFVYLIRYSFSKPVFASTSTLLFG